MKRILFLISAVVASTLSSQASISRTVYSEDFDSLVVTSVSKEVHEFGGDTPAVTYNEWFSASNSVGSSGGEIAFTDAGEPRMRGAGVWLNASAWVPGTTVTVSFEVTSFTASTNANAYFQAYTASGVDGSDAVGIDVHAGASAPVLSGDATSSSIGSQTAISGVTTVEHTFVYTGGEEIGLVFVNISGDTGTAAFTLDNLSVVAETVQPNIVLFYVDDLGWQDTELNDLDTVCPYETPNLTALAASGMNFPQAYSPAPTCAPSRGGIITGRHPAKTRFTNVTTNDRRDGDAANLLFDPYLDEQLDPTLLTTADALKTNGYSTGHSGKWHVGLTAASYGFDTVTHDRGAHRSMSSNRNDPSAFATTDADDEYQLSTEKYEPFAGSFPQGISYPYDEVTEFGLQFMEDNKDGPFFLNLWHWMVHWPVLTRNADLLQYYCEKFGHSYPPLSDDDDWVLPGQQNPYFAAMVTTVDWSLGRIVSYLEATDDPRYSGKKLIDTTYIVFSSDNGGAETRRDEIISDNDPLRGKKGNTTDGGIRVPMVVSGPGIAAGSVFDTMVNQLDYFPTFLSLTDTTIGEADFNELSGADLEPVLHGTSDQVIDPATQLEREFLFWHFPHYGTMYAALRSGDYKLHKSFVTGLYELYRLSEDGVRSDIEELVDLAGDPAHATILASLTAMLEGALVANNAEIPYLNPLYTERTEAVAELGSGSFQPATRQAQLTIDGSAPKITDAWVIYISPELKPGDQEEVTEQYMGGMRVAAALSVDGYSVNAEIPSSINSYCFMLVDENGFMQYTDEVDSDDIVMPAMLARWSLDETSGTTATDATGNGHDATVIGAEWSVGVSGGALYFDGVSDVAALPEAAFASIDSEISIALWAYGGATQPINDAALHAADVTNGMLLKIHLPWSNSKVFWDAGASDRVISGAASSDAIKGKWNHWVFTKDTSAGSLKVYLNGVLFASELTGNTESMAGITQAWLGGSNGLGQVSYEGLLDEVILYGEALTDAQVAALYNGYAPTIDFQAWLQKYPGLSDDSFAGDPEQDGVATGLEYVLSGKPTQLDQIILPEMDATGESFVFTFTRRVESVPFTEQMFQYGPDLSGWTDVNITEPRASEVSLGSIVGGLQEVTVTIPKNLAPDGKLFGRLKVVESN